MDLKLENIARDIKECEADEFKCEFEFVHEGERYKTSISVERCRKEFESRNRQAEGFCEVDEMIEEEGQEDGD